MIDPLDVPREHLRQFWPQARPFIERALAVDDLPYIAEDVYRFLSEGLATLHLTVDDDHKVTGCFVIRKQRTWDRDELYVWLLGHENPEHGVVEYLDWLNRLTRKASCSRWTADSPRPFHKVVPGLRLASHHFVMEV